MFKRENEQMEFKKSIKELREDMKSISGMLNKYGKGVIYFRVKNDGYILSLIFHLSIDLVILIFLEKYDQIYSYGLVPYLDNKISDVLTKFMLLYLYVFKFA